MPRPRRWAETTIGAICRLTNGMVFRSSDWSEGGLPIIRIQNLNAMSAPFNHYDGPVEARFRVTTGDLLFAWSGTPGTSFGAHIWQGPDAVLNQHIFKLDFDRSAIDSDFLCEAINETLEEQEAKSHGGVGLRHITRQAFSSTRIPFPPREEQVRLARLLSRLRARAGEIGKALEEVRRLAAPARLSVLKTAFEGELTREWRVRHKDVEPINALLARVPRPEQPRGGRGATARMIAGKAGISVNVPPIPLPEGWRWVSLHRLARQETGHTPSRRNPNYWGGSIPWLGIKDASASHGGRITRTLQTITPAGLANSAARLLPAATVCLSRTASVGYVTILGVDMATSQDFATWTCSPALLPDYLMYALMSEGSEIRKFGEGSVHTTIYFPEIRALHIRLAPLDEQTEIVRIIRLAFHRIDQLVQVTERSAAKVDHLLRSITALAFTGRLTVQEEGDGSAEEQLAKVRPPALDTSVVEPAAITSRRRKDVIGSLETVLREAQDWLPAQEAFRRCGVGSGAETEVIEQLFAELRVLDQAKKLLAKPILDESGRKIQDQLRLVG